MDSSGGEGHAGDVEEDVGLFCNGGSEVVRDSNDMPTDCEKVASVGEDGDADGVIVNNAKGSCWSRR